MTSEPKVTVGVPTYNGERFLSESLRSLRDQTYPDLEILISDNASTDRTGEICRKVAGEDERVVYHRNERNLGALQNFWGLVERAKGRYFMWAADHDLWDPSYVARCVEVLEDDPGVAICYARTTLIDEEGDPIEVMRDRIDTRGMSPPDRYRHLLWSLHNGNMIYGVIRHDLLASLPEPPAVVSPDYVILMGLGLRGTFAQIPESLFFRRARPGEDRRARLDRMLQDVDPDAAPVKRAWSTRRLQGELREAYLDILRDAGIPYGEKVRLALATLIRFALMWPGFLPLSVPFHALPPSLKDAAGRLLERV